MAKQTLPINFKDDALASAMGGKRRYILTENADGTFSLEDATTYTQVGDVLGAARLNAICKAVNESVDQAKVIDNVNTIKATTQSGYPAGALALKQVISDLAAAKTSFQGGVDTLYNECVNCGATPTAKTPAGIAAAIQAIYTNRYNAGVASVNKSGHCKVFLQSTWDGSRNHHIVTVTINGVDYISNWDVYGNYDGTQEFDFTL